MARVTVSQLGKAYKQYPKRWSRLVEWISRVPRHQLHWILQDINFTIESGEAVGIVGANGAGKSTLLKIITGTTRPTTGHLEISGRVAALLELGMGFHPDFTGRENAIMTGQLLGMTAAEVIALLPEIEAFAEIGAAIDQPVRTYSSGMQVRLAFSVATVQRPDLLIIDEALSVGDSYFQHKSFERIRSFRRAGTTLLIVSHDRIAIQSICDRAILLDGGRLAMSGKPEAVLDYYHALMAGREMGTVRQTALSDGSVQTVSGTGEARIATLSMRDENDQPIEIVQVGQAVVLHIEVDICQPVDRLVVGFMIKDRFGQPMYGINTHRSQQVMTDLAPGERVSFYFRFSMRLGQGNYSMSFSLSRFDSHLDKNYEWRDYGLIFQVINTSREDFVGCAWLDAKIETVQPTLTNVRVETRVGS
jgi:lipopolysaccharide transport system ATP-binding protein